MNNANKIIESIPEKFLEQLDDFDKLTWVELEKIIGYKISKREFEQVKTNFREIHFDNEFKKITSLSESARSIMYVKNKPEREDLHLRKIKIAIKKRFYLGLYYQNEDGFEGFRLVEPYVVGKGYMVDGVVSKEHSSDVYLRCFVIRDSVKDKSVRFKRANSESESENLPYWRMMRVDRILNLTTINRKISYWREGYTGGSDKNIRRILEYIPHSAFIKQNPN